MMWNDDGSGGDWWWLGLLIMAAFMVLCMVMMVRMMSHGGHGSSAGAPPRDRLDTPERTLADRLARGEIDTEEYQRRLGALQGSSELDRRPRNERRVE